MKTINEYKIHFRLLKDTFRRRCRSFCCCCCRTCLKLFCVQIKFNWGILKSINIHTHYFIIIVQYRQQANNCPQSRSLPASTALPTQPSRMSVLLDINHNNKSVNLNKFFVFFANYFELNTCIQREKTRIVVWVRERQRDRERGRGRWQTIKSRQRISIYTFMKIVHMYIYIFANVCNQQTTFLSPSKSYHDRKINLQFSSIWSHSFAPDSDRSKSPHCSWSQLRWLLPKCIEICGKEQMQNSFI